jgi:hypothetical protein
MFRGCPCCSAHCTAETVIQTITWLFTPVPSKKGRKSRIPLDLDEAKYWDWTFMNEYWSRRSHRKRQSSPLSLLQPSAIAQERTDLTTKPSSERSDLAQRSLNSFSHFALRRDVCSPARRCIARCASSRTRNAVCSRGSNLSASLATVRMLEGACIRGGARLQLFRAVQKRSSHKKAVDAQPFELLGIRVALQCSQVSATGALDE